MKLEIQIKYIKESQLQWFWILQPVWLLNSAQHLYSCGAWRGQHHDVGVGGCQQHRKNWVRSEGNLSRDPEWKPDPGWQQNLRLNWRTQRTGSGLSLHSNLTNIYKYQWTAALKSPLFLTYFQLRLPAAAAQTLQPTLVLTSLCDLQKVLQG